MVKKKSKSKKQKVHMDEEEFFQCETGHKNNWKLISTAVVIGIAFGLFLSTKQLDINTVTSYLTVVLVACVLAVLLDVRKVVLSVHYKLSKK